MKTGSEITNKSTSKAVAAARAHIEAWSNLDFEKVRKLLAADVHVRASTTQPIMAPVDTVGVDMYMEGLKQFVQGIVPGTAQITEAIGDDQNALVVVTVKARFGPNAPEVALPAARLYLFDEVGQLKAEQVIFYAAPA
jgi:hypothetical protein